MKITKSNALAFAQSCIKQAESISSLVKQSLEFDKKTGIIRNYKNDFAQIDQLKSYADKAFKLLNNPLPGFSFSEDSSIIVNNDILRSELVNISNHLKLITSFLLQQIEKNKQNIQSKDNSELLNKVDKALLVINSEVKLYEDEVNWLFAEQSDVTEKNRNINYTIGWKIPLLRKLIDALLDRIKKESESGKDKDYSNFIIKIVNTTNQFNDDLKLFASDVNAPKSLELNKTISKLIKNSVNTFELSSLELTGITIDEYSNSMCEQSIATQPGIQQDRELFHKIILSVQAKKSLSYIEAFNLIRKK